MLTRENIQELHSLADSRDKVEWRIGEIAAEAWERNLKEGAMLHKFQVFTAVAREARCSKGRVEKLYNMVRFFPPEIRSKYQGFKMGHYETAMNFGPEEAPDVLEYVQEYAIDTGELPKVGNLDFLYRREVQGQETEGEIGAVKVPAVPPDALQARIITLIASINSLLQKDPMSAERKKKLETGLGMIREALVDTEEIINYN